MRSSRKFSFLTDPNKLVLVRMYESTFTGLVGPPYPYYSLEAFSDFLCFITPTKTLTSKNKLTLNNNYLCVQTSKRMKLTYFALAFINI